MQQEFKDLESHLNTYYPGRVQMVKAGMATIGAVSIKDNRQCIATKYQGKSGSFKTTAASFFFPSCEELREYIHREDSFTPKSFVSHRGDKTKETLSKIDLLPKLRNKTLVSKEDATFFRCHKNEREDLFSRTASVLDGRGYVCSTGVHGRRGYEEDIYFTWLGCTTPLSMESHKIMGNLGQRFVFYNSDQSQLTDEELAQFLMSPNSQIEDETRDKMNQFLLTYFAKYPPNEVMQETVTVSNSQRLELARYANLTAKLRSVFSYKEEKNGDVRHGSPVMEDTRRLANIFKVLAIGSALMHDRNALDRIDLDIIRHMSLSSMPEHRRIVFNYLLETEKGELGIGDLVKRTGISKPTGLHYMTELSLLGIGKFHEYGGDFPQ